MSESSQAPSSASPQASQAAPAAQPSQSAESVDSVEQVDSQDLEAQVAEENPDLSKAEVKKEANRIKKLKFKVDGKEFEEDLPFEIPDDEKSMEYMRKQIQMSKMGSKRAQEKAELEKEVLRFVDELRKNPRKALSDPAFGVDLKQLAAEIIQDEIANESKSPEQREKEKLENELKALKEEREKEKEELRNKELERLKEQEFERYDMLMSQALEKSDLPKSPYVVKKMADYMLLGLQAGIEVTPQDVLPLVREEIQGDLKDMFSIMPDEVVEAIVGKDTINRLRKKNLAKAKTQPPQPVKGAVKDTGKKAEKSDEPKSKQTFRDYFGV